MCENDDDDDDDFAGMELIAGAKGVATPVYSIFIDLIKTSQGSAEAEAYLESIVHVRVQRHIEGVLHAYKIACGIDQQPDDDDNDDHDDDNDDDFAGHGRYRILCAVVCSRTCCYCTGTDMLVTLVSLIVCMHDRILGPLHHGWTCVTHGMVCACCSLLFQNSPRLLTR
jgi:hypothetical protein